MPRPTLQRFIDDELDRAPLLMREVIANVQESLRQGDGASLEQRRLLYDLQRPLAQQSQPLVAAFVQALRDLVGAAARQPGASLSAASRLSLLDESSVAADVEISRAIEAIETQAEHEVRELRRYVAAVVGDTDVARDSNPFRPECYARAVWQALQSLPMSRNVQLALMHHVAQPLARAVRIAYAAACTRLEDMGIEPAAYRTVILPPGSRRARPNPGRHDLSSDMNRLRQTMPAPFLDLKLPIPDAQELDLEEFERATAPQPPAGSAEQQLQALVQRLFESMLADPALPAPLQPLIAGLEPAALAVALSEPGMIDNEGHAAWRFIDRLAFAAEVPLYDPPGLARMLRVAQGLVDHIGRAPKQDEALFRWAEDRLVAMEQHALQQRVADAARVIAPLRQLDAAPAGETAAEGSDPLDAGTLDTVPASLLDLASIDAAVKSTRASKWLDARRPGDLLRLFMNGQWSAAQLLWHSDTGTVWLLAALPAGPQWALRRNAMERLWSEGLADLLAPRSLIHDAAERVLKDMAEG